MSEYLKIDKFSITQIILIFLLYLIINLFMNVSKKKIKKKVYVLLLVDTFLAVLAVLCTDMRIYAASLMLMAICLFITAFVCGEKKLVISISLVIQILSVICIAVTSIFAKKYLEAFTLQSVAACSAMGIEKADMCLMLLVISAIGLVVSTLTYIFSKEKNYVLICFTDTVFMLAGSVNIVMRMLPDYYGIVQGSILKYTGIGLMIAGAVLSFLLKKRGNMVTAIPMYIIGVIFAIGGTGYPLTAWIAIMLVIQLFPVMAILLMNEYGEENKYITLSMITAVILLPLADAAYKLSIFKSFIKMENIRYGVMLGIGEALMIIVLSIWIWKEVRSEYNVSDRRTIVTKTVAVIMAAIAVLSIPVITFKWIYSMMSQTELMIANIGMSRIPLQEIYITIGVGAVIFLVPLIPVLIRKKSYKHD